MNSRIIIDPLTDTLIVNDATGTFMGKHVYGGISYPDGGLPVANGHMIIPVILKVEPVFAGSVEVIEDEHPFGHIGSAGSYNGVEANKAPLTLESIKDWAPNRIASPYYDLEYLKWYLPRTRDQMQMPWSYHGLPQHPETRLHPALRGMRIRGTHVKGRDPKCDSYSPFRDNLDRPTDLGDDLRAKKVKRVFFTGLVKEVCVGYGALDGRREGFEVFLIDDAIGRLGVPSMLADMEKRLQSAGVVTITSDQIVGV